MVSSSLDHRSMSSLPDIRQYCSTQLQGLQELLTSKDTDAYSSDCSLIYQSIGNSSHDKAQALLNGHIKDCIGSARVNQVCAALMCFYIQTNWPTEQEALGPLQRQMNTSCRCIISHLHGLTRSFLLRHQAVPDSCQITSLTNEKAPKRIHFTEIANRLKAN